MFLLVFNCRLVYTGKPKYYMVFLAYRNNKWWAIMESVYTYTRHSATLMWLHEQNFKHKLCCIFTHLQIVQQSGWTFWYMHQWGWLEINRQMVTLLTMILALYKSLAGSLGQGVWIRQLSHKSRVPSPTSLHNALTFLETFTLPPRPAPRSCCCIYTRDWINLRFRIRCLRSSSPLESDVCSHHHP